MIKAETLEQFREMMSPAAVREIYVAVVDDLDKRIAALLRAVRGRRFAGDPAHRALHQRRMFDGGGDAGGARGRAPGDRR